MSNPTAKRIIVIGSIILSGLTIFLCVGGIFITWLVNLAAGSLVVDLSVATEKTAQTLQRGVARMETSVTNLQSEVGSISEAAAQISQNIADQGIARTLLPEERFTRLDTFTERLTTTFDAVGDALSSARDTYRAINRIPGVNLPQPDLEITTQLNEDVTAIRNDVQDLKAGIQRVRGGAANTVNQLAEVADGLSERLDNILARLENFSSALDNIQLASQQARRTIPPLLTLFAVVLTLVQIWVIYTQVIVLRLNLAKWRSPEPAVAVPTLASRVRPTLPPPISADSPPPKTPDEPPQPPTETSPPAS